MIRLVSFTLPDGEPFRLQDSNDVQAHGQAVIEAVRRYPQLVATLEHTLEQLQLLGLGSGPLAMRITETLKMED